MKIREISYSEYKGLTKEVYSGNSAYKNTNEGFVSEVFRGTNEFSKNSTVMPVGVFEHGQIVVAAVLIIAHACKEMLQVSFFEALPDKQLAVDLLLTTAKETASSNGCTRVVIGINGHENYGLGLLADNYDLPPSYGSSYNPEYYLDYFEHHATKAHGMTSFKGEVQKFNLGGLSERALERLTKKFSIRPIDFSRLEEEASLFAKVNDRCFENQPFYFKRKKSEGLEALQKMMPLLKEENILFAHKGEEVVGYILWHPDFNEAVSPGGSLDEHASEKITSEPQMIKGFKMSEIGILPEYHNSGAILALINRCASLVRGRYENFESGWILDSNTKSKDLVRHITESEYKHYKVYEIAL